MSYRIEYSNSKIIRSKAKTIKRKNSRLYCGIIISIFCLLLCYYFRDYLIPGEPEVTKAAFFQMAEMIGEGEPWTNAIEVFCTEIVNHAIGG